MTQIHWLNPISDSFTNPSAWSGGVVPGANDVAILDAAGTTPYTVTSSVSETVNSIQTGAHATLALSGYFIPFNATNGTGAGVNAGLISVGEGATFAAGGTMDNSGVIDLGIDASFVIDPAGVTLTGGGTIMSDKGSIGYYGNGGALTNVDNVISGFFDMTPGGLVNDSRGVIDASGAKYSVVAAQGPSAILNAGLIESTSTGPLILDDVANSASGVVLAGNGAVIGLQNVSGGTLETLGTGIFEAGVATFDGTGSTLNNQGVIYVSALNYAPPFTPKLTIEGAINNSGTITIDSSLNDGKFSYLLIGPSNAVLTGGGIIALSANGRNIVTSASSTATLTNAGDTISGAGLLGNGAMGLVNQATGVIDGNAAASLVLDTGPNTTVNAGLIEGTGAAGLTIRSTTIDGSSSGVILAGDGSHVGLQGATLIGGTLKSTGNGQIKTFLGGPNLLDGTAFAVNNLATLVVQNGTALTLQGSIFNAGKIALGSGGAATTLTIGKAGAFLYGGGRILLSNGVGNQITGASSAAILTNVNNLITGAGRLGAGSLALVNDAQGAIAGSLATALVIDTGANTIVNAGQILARGAGGVIIQSAVANSGRLEATGGVLTVNGAVSGLGFGVIFSGTLDFTAAFSQNVVFNGTTGVLELAAQSQNYAGQVFGFSKTGGTALDLRDIGFVSSTEATFSGTAGGGVLTVTDGTKTAHIALKGDYTASTFIASSDGHGGTLVVDPAAASAAHRFVAAAASLGGWAGGSTSLAHDSWRAPATMLARPRMETA